MKEELQELYKYRELLYMIAYRDIKVRYKQSIMGFLWAILMPVLIVMAGIVVRYAYALASHVPLQTADIASVAVKSLPWAFLVSSIRFALQQPHRQQQRSGDQDLFPERNLSLGSRDGQSLRFLCGVGSPADLSVDSPSRLELLSHLDSAFASDHGDSGRRYRNDRIRCQPILPRCEIYRRSTIDVWNFLYACFLRRQHVRATKAKWLLLNPVAPILDGLSACIVRHQTPDLPWLAYSTMFGITAFLGGYIFFKHLEPAFAESI